MRILSFSAEPYGTADSVGEISMDLEFLVTNPTQSTVRMVRYLWSVVDADGVPVGGTSEFEDEACLLEPGGDMCIRKSCTLWDSGGMSGRRALTATVQVRLLAREYLRLGEIEVPADDMRLGTARIEASSQLIGRDVRASVVRRRDGGVGPLVVSAFGMFRNVADVRLDPLELRVELLDAEGDSVLTESQRFALDPGASAVVESMLFPKAAGARDSRVRLALLVHHAVHVAEFSGSSLR